MSFVKVIVLFFIFSSILFAGDDMDALLSQYKEESKLSKITKREAAGFLDLYTRDDLEKMQAHNLLDVFKTIPGLILTKNVLATNTFSRMKMYEIRSSTTRLYINDHEMTSASYGSAFVTWGDMPIEYVDHIEVYKASSSIEFGNEVAFIVVRVYTKQAKREEGGKVRLLASDNGGYDTNVYYAQSLENGLSYFIYANKDNLKRDVEHNYHNSKEYDIKSDRKSYTLFANFNYDDWILDLGTYDKVADSFLGPGIYKTPSGDEIASRHTYAHLSKTFKNDFKLQLSYDNIMNDAHFIDENGIAIADPNSPGFGPIPAGVWVVNDYQTTLNDEIISTVLEKRFKSENNTLLLGGFYKYKKFEDSAVIAGMMSYIPGRPYYNKFGINNALHLSSVYLEDCYSYDDTLQFIVSAKGDFYRYEKKVKSQDKFIGRVAAIKNIDNFQFKGFATYSYVPATFLELYNDYNTPVKVNPDLKYPTQIVYSGSVGYKDGSHFVEAIFANAVAKDAISMSYINGYQNSKQEVKTTSLELRYQYRFNKENKIYIDYATANNNKGVDVSPSYTFSVRMFNSYKKFDFYNEFIVRDAYFYSGKGVPESYDYTSSIKYHISDDISVGVRGDNIFDTGFKERYNDYYKSIPITQQRFWINLEVLF